MGITCYTTTYTGILLLRFDRFMGVEWIPTVPQGKTSIIYRMQPLEVIEGNGVRYSKVDSFGYISRVPEQHRGRVELRLHVMILCIIPIIHKV